MSTNKLKTDYPCDTKLGLCIFHHYLPMLKKTTKVECHFEINSSLYNKIELGAFFKILHLATLWNFKVCWEE